MNVDEEAVERLARYLAHEWVMDWIMGEHWYGYPDPDSDNEIAEAIEGHMERSREKARKFVAILRGDDK